MWWKGVNETERKEGGEESESEMWWGKVGAGGLRVPSCCINLQIFSDDARTATLPPVPSPSSSPHPSTLRASPDASRSSDGRQRHTAGKPGRRLVVIFFLRCMLPFIHCWQWVCTICHCWQTYFELLCVSVICGCCKKYASVHFMIFSAQMQIIHSF